MEEDSSIRILIASARVANAEDEDNIFGKDIDTYFYYLLKKDSSKDELKGSLVQLSTANGEDLSIGSIDLRNFFSNIGLADDKSIFESSTLLYAISILREIVKDIENKNKYYTLEDLARIPENYEMPINHENHNSYMRRVLINK